MATHGQAAMDHAVLDDIIRRLTEVRSARPGKQVQLSEAEIKQLCVASRDIFLQQPVLLELEAPIKICGPLNYPNFSNFSCCFSAGFCGIFLMGYCSFYIRLEVEEAVLRKGYFRFCVFFFNFLASFRYCNLLYSFYGGLSKFCLGLLSNAVIEL
jgi:hypothetical protein